MKRKYYFAVLLILFEIGFIISPVSCLAQIWVRRYNGPGGDDDVARDVAIDGSGNIYVTGYSYGSSKDVDYTTIKYDSSGNTIWVKRYNGPSNGDDWAHAIAVDKNGNVYVTGNSMGLNTDYDYATVKYNSVGDMIWVKRYDGSENDLDRINDIAVDRGGNVYVTGSCLNSGTGFDYVTIKYSPTGGIIWVRKYNGSGNGSDAAHSIAIDDSGNVYVTGESEGSFTGTDYATIKYNSFGKVIWVRRYNGVDDSIDVAEDITVDDKGNVYVTGYSYSPGKDWDYATIKYDPSGNIKWARRYNGPGNYIDAAQAIAVDKNGYIYVTGVSFGLNTDRDFATIKYDSTGDIVWIRRYNGPGNDIDVANAISVDENGGIYVTGESYGLNTGRDFATIKYTQSGDVVWVKRYNGPGNGDDEAQAISIDKRGYIYVVGSSVGLDGFSDFTTIKYSTLDSVKATKSRNKSE